MRRPFVERQTHVVVQINLIISERDADYRGIHFSRSFHLSTQQSLFLESWFIFGVSQQPAKAYLLAIF